MIFFEVAATKVSFKHQKVKKKDAEDIRTVEYNIQTYTALDT